MSSETFEILEDELITTISDIRRRVELQIPRLSGESRKKTVRETENAIESAVSMIDDMQVEVHKAPQGLRTSMNTKVKKHRDEVAKLQSKIRQFNSGTVSFTRQELFAGEGASSTDLIAEQRNRVLETDSILNRTSQSIARSQQVAVETEQIGNDIITEMGDQRDSLLRTRDRLEGTDANLRQSRKILKSMYLRVMTNKLILVFIILVELGILAGVVYWKFFR